MSEDLSYLRSRLDEACSGIARLEEQNKTLFRTLAKHEANQEKHRAEHDGIKVDLTTTSNLAKAAADKADALEKTKASLWDKAWQIIVLIIGAFVAGWAGSKTGKNP